MEGGEGRVEPGTQATGVRIDELKMTYLGSVLAVDGSPEDFFSFLLQYMIKKILKDGISDK